MSGNSGSRKSRHHRRNDIRGNIINSPRRVDDHEPVPLTRREVKKPLTDTLVEVRPLAFKPGLRGRAGTGAAQPFLDIHVKQNGPVSYTHLTLPTKA